MRRRDSETIESALFRMLREEGLETPLNEYRLESSWNEVMGDMITRYTGRLYVRSGILYVQIKSSALKSNLIMSRKGICEKLNAFVGANVIKEIVFL